MHFFRILTLRVCLALPLLALFGTQARAQAVALSPGDAHYYAGVPLNFIAQQPRPGTFYYNDFNRYGYYYYPEGTYVYVPVWGYYDGSEDSRDFNGQAIIGEDRGQIGLSLAGSNYLKRSSSGPGNTADPLFELTQTGSPGGNVTLQAMDTALSVNLGIGLLNFTFSTAGYSGIQFSFDLKLVVGASANYRLQASPDGGATWTYVDETTLIGLKAGQWFNGIPAETNPQAFFDLSGHPEFDNNPNLVIQIYAIPDPDTDLWTSESGTTSDLPYPMSLSFDRLNLTGTAISTATALQQWRQTHFGTTASADDAADAADPDGDGLANLVEYAVGSLPKDPASSLRPAPEVADGKLQLKFNRVADGSLLYEVLASSTLEAADWSPIWSSTGSANLAGEVVVDDSENLDGHSRRFLRLRVSVP